MFFHTFCLTFLSVFLLTNASIAKKVIIKGDAASSLKVMKYQFINTKTSSVLTKSYWVRVLLMNKVIFNCLLILSKLNYCLFNLTTRLPMCIVNLVKFTTFVYPIKITRGHLIKHFRCNLVFHFQVS